jgi:hypothetical protein
MAQHAPARLSRSTSNGKRRCSGRFGKTRSRRRIALVHEPSKIARPRVRFATFPSRTQTLLLARGRGGVGASCCSTRRRGDPELGAGQAAATKGAADDKQGRLALCKYLLRAPPANEHLRIQPDERVRLDFAAQRAERGGWRGWARRLAQRTANFPSPSCERLPRGSQAPAAARRTAGQARPAGSPRRTRGRPVRSARAPEPGNPPHRFAHAPEARKRVIVDSSQGARSGIGVAFCASTRAPNNPKKCEVVHTVRCAPSYPEQARGG